MAHSSNSRTQLNRHVHGRLKLSLTGYFFISIVLIGVVIFHVVVDRVSLFFPILGMAVGVAIGVAVSLIYRITWDHGAQKVISRFDKISAAILGLYLIFEIFKEEIIEHFVHGPAVVATSSALLAGIMMGRVLGIGGKIVRVLREQNLTD